MSRRCAALLPLALLLGCPPPDGVDDDDAAGDDDDFTGSDDDDATGDDDDSAGPPAAIDLLAAHLALFVARNVPEGLDYSLSWAGTVDDTVDRDALAEQIAAAWTVLDRSFVDATASGPTGWATLEGEGLQAFAAAAVRPALVDGAVVVEVGWTLDGAPATNLAVVRPDVSDAGDVAGFLVAAVDSFRVLDASTPSSFSFEDGFGNPLETFTATLGCAGNQCVASAEATEALPGCSVQVASDDRCEPDGCASDVAFVGSCGAATFTRGDDGRFVQDAGTFGRLWFDGRVELSVSCPCEGGLDGDGDGQAPDDGDCDDEDPTVFEGADELCDDLDNDCDGALSAAELDGDGDAVTGCDGDCDDADPTVAPGNPEACDGLDTDCDGAVPAGEGDGDGDGLAACAGDCDDADPANFSGNAEACDGADNDCDGALSAEEIDGDGDGVTDCDGDCDDADPARHPGAAEICGGVDEDCDGALGADEIDGDGDGVTDCDGDCADGDPSTYSGAPESCDGVDNDCDGAVPASEADGDGDGVWPCAGDCNDGSPAVFPGNDEACDGVDNDCSGDAGVPVLWQSGSGTLAASVTCGAGCVLGNVYVPAEDVQVAGVEFFAGDATGGAVAHVVVYRRAVPGQPWVLLSAAEVELGPNKGWVGSLSLGGAAQAGQELLVGLAWTGTVEHDRLAPTNTPPWGALSGVQESGADLGLLVTPWAGPPAILGGEAVAVRIHTGVNEEDADADGLLACEECDDDDPLRGDGFVEACDGVDNDCDGAVPASEADADGDGVRACTDCDDADPLRTPGALEVCDGLDNNCDNVVPTLERDLDGDGSLACIDDCDDLDPAEAPGNAEICEDGLDNDCDGQDFACLLPCWSAEGFEGAFPTGWSASTASTYSLSAAAAHDGAIGYRDTAGNDGWWYRDDVAWGLDGDRLSLWYFAQAGRAQLGFASSSAGTYSFGLADNTNQLRWEDNAGWATASVANTSLAVASGAWYRVEVEVLDQASGLVEGRVYGADGVTLLGSSQHAWGAPLLGGIGFRGFGGDLDSVIACAHQTSWVVDLTPPTGSAINDASIGWANRGYRFVATQDFAATGLSWKVNLPLDGTARARVYDAAGAALATGADVSGTGVDEWLRSDLSWSFVAGQTYTVAFWTDRSFSGGADRISGPTDGWAVDGVVEAVEVVARHVGSQSSNNQLQGFPADSDTVGMLMHLHVGP